jgi:hypothetical protein
MAGKPGGRIPTLIDRLVATYPARSGEVRTLLTSSGVDPDLVNLILRPKLGRPPQDLKELPTLNPKVSRKPSPQLRARFERAGTINELGCTMLSVAEMKKVHHSEQLHEVLASQAEKFPDSAAGSVDPERVSVFAVSSLEDGEIDYLVWPKATGEPEIWSYCGEHEQRHKDLASYLGWIIGKAK